MAMTAPKFAFQRLEVYGVAKAVAQLTVEHRRRWADVPGELAERLARATLSTLVAIAAGAATTARAEQRRQFQLARASANEAMSCIEMAQLHDVVPDELYAMLATQLARVDQMLTGMVRRRTG